MVLRLSTEEATEWLAGMERQRYALEDAIGCSINVEHGGKLIECAHAVFPVSEFKDVATMSANLRSKVLAWVGRVVAAGADQVGVVISKRDGKAENA